MTETFNYDPNIRWATHTVGVTFQLWQHSRSVTTQVGGNTRGFSVLRAAVENLIDDDEIVKQDEYGVLSIVLQDAEGHLLIVEDTDNRGFEWLKEMVVGCRIIDFEEAAVEQPVDPK